MISKNFKILRIPLATILFVTIICCPLSASALTLQQQKDLKLQQQQEAQRQADQKAKEAAQIQTQIAVVQNQITETDNALKQTNDQIDLTNATIADLQSQIKTKEDDLITENGKLGDVISSWYMQGDDGLLASLIGSNTVSELLDKQQYYDSIRQQIQTAMEQIQKTKDDLALSKNEQEQKNSELLSLKTQQEGYKQTAVSQRNQKDRLLTMTNQQKTAYLDLINKLQGEINTLSAQIYAARQNTKNNEVWVYGSSSYPYSAVHDVDLWGFLTKECTSYAAWYWNVKLGKSWLRDQPGADVHPSGAGNANNWPNLAHENGATVSSTPRKGAIISWAGNPYTMPYGHVAIVEAVNSNGTIKVSEYNWSKYAYTERDNVNPSDYGSYSYIYK